MYRIQRSDALAPLLADADRWDALAGGIPFRESSWISTWWRIFGDDLEPYVLVARDGRDEICGILPLYRERAGLPCRKLRIMGDGNTCSDFLSVLARSPEAAADVASEMGAHLTAVSGDAHDGWDLIEIDGISEGDAGMNALADAMRQRGVTLHACSRHHTWFQTCAQSWQQYLDSLSRQRRSQTGRFVRRLEKSPEMSLVQPDSREAVYRAVDSLIEMHQRRWQQVGEPGSYATAEARQFLHDVADSFFHRGRLNLVTLMLAGRPIGAALHLIGGGGRLYCYSTGNDPDHANSKPGNIITSKVLWDAHHSDADGVEYLRGDELYKQRLGAEPKRLLQLRAFAPGWLPRLRHVAWSTGFELKQFARRRTGRKPVERVDLAQDSGVCGTAGT